jgi:hypothetical protein
MAYEDLPQGPKGWPTGCQGCAPSRGGYNTDFDLVADEAANSVRTLARSAAEGTSAAAGSPQQTVY